MYKTTGQRNSRIEVADALRGLAVAGIILFHSVEHTSPIFRKPLEEYRPYRYVLIGFPEK